MVLPSLGFLATSLWFCATISITVSLSQQRTIQRGRLGHSSSFFTKNLKIPSLPCGNVESKYGPSIPVCYTNSPRSASLWLEDHIPSGAVTVGFDVESVPNVPWLKTRFEGPATVQIAVAEAALVVQLVDGDGNPSDASVKIMEALLADESIIKAGVGIDQDMLELYREWGGNTAIRSRFDIGGLGGKSGRTVALKTLTGAVIDVELQKSKKLAVSNWGQVPLRDAQIAYCARDAWAAAAVMEELAERDHDTFSTQSLIKLLENELSIAELDVKARDRKFAKTRFSNIMGKRETRVALEDLSDVLQDEVNELQKTMRTLAPPRPYIFDVNPLGINL